MLGGSNSNPCSMEAVENGPVICIWSISLRNRAAYILLLGFICVIHRTLPVKVRRPGPTAAAVDWHAIQTPKAMVFHVGVYIMPKFMHLVLKD